MYSYNSILFLHRLIRICFNKHLVQTVEVIPVGTSDASAFPTGNG
jgi:hypothetical protein